MVSIKKKILIVEDAFISRALLRKIFEKEYVVLEAANGQEALEILRKEQNAIAVMLLDIQMPVMNGYELLDIIKQDELLCHVPVIMISAQDDEHDESKAFAYGVVDYITKPFKPNLVQLRVANLINMVEASAIAKAIKLDSLTSIYNKEYFFQKCREILDENPDKKYAMVCSDIKNFKLINDTYGMVTGDALLRHYASVAKEFAVRHGGICGRIGSDIFAALIEQFELSDAGVVEYYVNRINEYPISNNISVKFGIYDIHDKNIAVSGMCDRAKLALKTIKDTYGVSFGFYDDTLRQKILIEQNILDNMENAIEQRQFKVYLQPKYNINNDRVAGAEALVRWIHPKYGFMSPADFVPIFERNGFITKLDYYVWEETCRCLRAQLDSGKDVVPISVNVSRADIFNSDLPGILFSLMRKYDLDPSWMHLEITESAYTKQPKQIVETVSSLRHYGFVIEMDDFGTGYSSLSMLAELPIDILKLDRGFIQNELKKDSKRYILSFIISLARWLNLAVTAEGVETKEQVESLKNMDCNYVQGYYYAKPMPMEEYIDFITTAPLDKTPLPPNRVMNMSVDLSPVDDAKKTILIVDDVASNRAIFKCVFKNYYNIAEASNGKAAYEYIKENSEDIAVVMLDLIMPIMDGFQLLEILKADEKYKNIPIVVTSQFGEDSEFKALKLGADDFISKPFNPVVLIHHVNNILLLSEIKKQKRILELRGQALQDEAYRDALTGLYNRRGLETAIEELKLSDSRSKHAFFFVDIDNLKNINDTYGHLAGDEAIKEVCKIMAANTRSDDITARIGGDEFVIVLRSPATLTQAEKKGKLLCSAFRTLAEAESGKPAVSCSVGITLMGIDESIDCATKRADEALYAVKKKGKGGYKINY